MLGIISITCDLFKNCCFFQIQLWKFNLPRELLAAVCQSHTPNRPGKILIERWAIAQFNLIDQTFLFFSIWLIRLSCEAQQRQAYLVIMFFPLIFWQFWRLIFDFKIFTDNISRSLGTGMKCHTPSRPAHVICKNLEIENQSLELGLEHSSISHPVLSSCSAFNLK